MKSSESEKRFLNLQYMYLTPPRDKLDRALRCVRLQWITDVDTDYTSAQRDWSSEAHPLKAGEWFGVEPFCSSKSTIHVVQENLAFALYSKEVPWPLGRFYINRFYKAYS